MISEAITCAVEAAKDVAADVLQPVEWLQKTGDKDERGRQAVTVTTINVLIESEPGLARGSDRVTDRSDETMLTVLEPLAIKDSDTFRWGTPPHTYKVKNLDGVVQDPETGVRYATVATVIR